MNVNDEVFIGFPSAVHWGERGAASSKKGTSAINQLLWGDWARVEEIAGNWIKVRSRRRSGWVRKEQLQTERLLEVNFVDVGQGDGAHIQTPDDKALLVDAGDSDNLFRFCRWRFGRFANQFDFEAAVISHPDKDHYYGFTEFFEHEKINFGTIFHNCIVEQMSSGKASLGREAKLPGSRKKAISGLVHDLAELKAITDSGTRCGDRLYPNMLKKAVDSGRVGDFVGLLASRHVDSPAFLPGFGPNDGRGMVIKVLGPLPELLSNGNPALRTLGSSGKTKNGHSVILQIEIGSVRIQLAGDLNNKAQDYLLESYTGLKHPPKNEFDNAEMVDAARPYFEAEVAKACHHGSPDVSSTFLQAVNPLATVVSSGDNEPHGHPRPDTLGIIGKFGRGERPMIFSTEIARSTKDTIQHPAKVRAEVRSTIVENTAILDDPTKSAAQKKKAEDRIEKALRQIDRSVANYGMINLRTDGKRLIMAQRLERKRSRSVRWDIHEFETDSHGRLRQID